MLVRRGLLVGVAGETDRQTDREMGGELTPLSLPPEEGPAETTGACRSQSMIPSE